jgi:hypothetical protein
MIKFSNPGPFCDDPKYKAMLWCFAIGAPEFTRFGLTAESLYELPDTEEYQHMRSNSLRRDLDVQTRDDMIKLLETDWDEPTSFDEKANFLSTLSMEDRTKFLQLQQQDEQSDYGRWKSVYDNLDRLPRHITKARNHSLFMHVTKGGAFVKLISEEEAISYAIEMGLKIQEQYSGWDEFAMGYAVGTQFSQRMFNESQSDQAWKYVKYLIHHPDSLWNKLDWNTALDV